MPYRVVALGLRFDRKDHMRILTGESLGSLETQPGVCASDDEGFASER